MTIYKDGNTFSDRPLPGGGVVEHLSRVVRPQTQGPVVAPAEARKPITASIGKSLKPVAEAGGGTGIENLPADLTETNYTLREWHVSQVYTSDGIFSADQIKKIVLTDPVTEQIFNLNLAAKP